ENDSDSCAEQEHDASVSSLATSASSSGGTTSSFLSSSRSGSTGSSCANKNRRQHGNRNFGNLRGTRKQRSTHQDREKDKALVAESTSLTENNEAHHAGDATNQHPSEQQQEQEGGELSFFEVGRLLVEMAPVSWSDRGKKKKESGSSSSKGNGGGTSPMTLTLIGLGILAGTVGIAIAAYFVGGA
ncbi:unnamed protein product, partial [Amoebophrya sp. A25]